MSEGSFGKGEQSQQSSTNVTVPDWLRPFLGQATNTASGALNQLQQQSGGDLVAGFSPLQQLAQQLGADRVMGAGGFFPTAQNTFLQAAQGQGVESFLNPGAFNELNNAMNAQFLPDQSRQTLANIGQGGQIPGMEFLQGQLGNSGVPGGALSALNQGAQGFGLDPQALQTLQQTANGDFLQGGAGFDSAVQAAVRSAQPAIQSAFGQSVGGSDSGLAQAAIGQSATDAFARQYGQERQNQQQAASTLGQFGLQQGNQRLGAAGQLGQLGLADRGQQGGFAGLLGNLGLSGQGQQLGAIGQLAGIGQGEQGLGLSAAGLFSELGNSERNRQLGAAGQLPGLATADINLLSGIGGQQQQLAQMGLDAPRMAQLQLLQAALGGLPLSSLFGQDSSGSGSYSGFSTGFGG